MCVANSERERHTHTYREEVGREGEKGGREQQISDGCMLLREGVKNSKEPHGISCTYINETHLHNAIYRSIRYIIHVAIYRYTSYIA